MKSYHILMLFKHCIQTLNYTGNNDADMWDIMDFGEVCLRNWKVLSYSIDNLMKEKIYFLRP